MTLLNTYLLIGFFLITSLFIIFFGKMKNTIEGKRIIALHLIALFCFIIIYRLKSHSEIFLVIASWMPLLLIFYFYQSAGVLSRSLHSKTFDNCIIDFEKKIFGKYYPCLWLSDQLDFYWLSEYLHFCYFSYFLLLYGIPFYFYIHQQYYLFYQFEYAQLLVLLPSFLMHSLVPVLSPRTIYEKIPDALRRGPLYRLVHHAVTMGSAEGTAFPSTHVGTGTLVILVSLYFHTPFFLMVIPIALGLVLATIYGRFHYVVDLIAGVVMALFSFCLIY